MMAKRRHAVNQRLASLPSRNAMADFLDHRAPKPTENTEFQKRISLCVSVVEIGAAKSEAEKLPTDRRAPVPGQPRQDERRLSTSRRAATGSDSYDRTQIDSWRFAHASVSARRRRRASGQRRAHRLGHHADAQARFHHARERVVAGDLDAQAQRALRGERTPA
jgi:hypothetical protein